jgi:hypothetical protein
MCKCEYTRIFHTPCYSCRGMSWDLMAPPFYLSVSPFMMVVIQTTSNASADLDGLLRHLPLHLLPLLTFRRRCFPFFPRHQSRTLLPAASHAQSHLHPVAYSKARIGPELCVSLPPLSHTAPRTSISFDDVLPSSRIRTCEFGFSESSKVVGIRAHSATPSIATSYSLLVPRSICLLCRSMDDSPGRLVNWHAMKEGRTNASISSAARYPI